MEDIPQRNEIRGNAFRYANRAGIAILIFAAGIFAGQLPTIQAFLGNPNPHLPQVANANLYNEVWDLVHSDFFIKNVNNSDLFYSSIKGMVASLNDPATLYLSPSDEKAFEQETSGNTFAGIGVELGYKNSKIIVERILNGPATNTNLRVGDIIASVDGKSTEGIDISTVTNEIRGQEGSTVTLGIIDLNANSENLSIKRQSIHIAGMYIQQTTDPNGKKTDELVISRFTEDTPADWESEWDTMVKNIIADKPDNVVIDLRDNPGGFFDAAIYALADFLPKNTLAAMQQDRNGQKIRYYTQTDPRLSNMPLTVLVNGNTASAAEIFSGALQHYKRASIVGTNTYGKGTAQEVYSFSDGSSLHLTTDHWLLPSGRWIQKSDPIKPDYQVDFTNNDYLQGNDPQLIKAISLVQ